MFILVSKLRVLFSVVGVINTDVLIIWTLMSMQLIFKISVPTWQKAAILHYKDQAVNAVYCQNNMKLMN
jgi:hypothetical protein